MNPFWYYHHLEIHYIEIPCWTKKIILQLHPSGGVETCLSHLNTNRIKSLSYQATTSSYQFPMIHTDRNHFNHNLFNFIFLRSFQSLRYISYINLWKKGTHRSSSRNSIMPKYPRSHPNVWNWVPWKIFIRKITR